MRWRRCRIPSRGELIGKLEREQHAPRACAHPNLRIGRLPLRTSALSREVGKAARDQDRAQHMCGASAARRLDRAQVQPRSSLDLLDLIQEAIWPDARDRKIRSSRGVKISTYATVDSPGDVRAIAIRRAPSAFPYI